jgi:hypothetical protein
MLRKVVGDAARIVRMVGEAAGVWEGASVDFDRSWARVKSEVLAGVGSTSSQADREDALCRLEDLTALIAVKSAPVLDQEVRRIADRSIIEGLVTELATSESITQNPSLWNRLTAAEPSQKPDPRADLLDEKLGKPLAAIIWKRALLGATVTHAAVGATQLDDRIG